MKRQKLTGLEHYAYQHPSDRVALNAIKKIPVLDKVVGYIMEKHCLENEIALSGSAFEVTAKSCPHIHGIFLEACDIFCQEPPRLYIEDSMDLNASMVGIKNPLICMTTRMVSNFNDAELLYVLGHELGHHACGHTLYHNLALFLAQIGSTAIPMAGVAQFTIDHTVFPLLSVWSRRAEYSCDRAGLLVCQDMDAACSAMLKLAGFPEKYYHELKPGLILEQAERFQQSLGEGRLRNLLAMKQQFYASHPRLIERAGELNLWRLEGWFDDIVYGSDEVRCNLSREMARDPVEAEMLIVALQVIVAAYVETFDEKPETVAPPIREALISGKSLRYTAAEKLLHVELHIARESVNAIRYSLILLINKDGSVIKQEILLPFPEEWSEAPDSLRAMFIRENKKLIIRELYKLK